MAYDSSLGIDSMEYGFDSRTFQTYLNTIQAIVLHDMADVLNTGYNDIKTACNDNWAGTAKENFITNLGKDIDKIKVLYTELYSRLEGVLKDTQGSMAEMDKQLISID